MTTFWQDLRYGARMLWKSPGFTVVAVLALALGVGANTAIFSVVHALMLRELPYKDSDRLVMVWEANRPRDRHQNVISPANFIDWGERNTVFEGMSAFVDYRSNLTGMGDPAEVPVQGATPNLFPLLGVEPILGRGFTPEDAAQNAPPVVVLSYPFWQSRFGGDPGVVGKTLTLGGETATVVGVMPAGFQWLIQKGSLTGKQPEVWEPLGFGEQHRIRRGRYMMSVARLKPGVTRERAQAEMDSVAAQLEGEYADFNKGWGVEVVPVRQQFAGEISTALWILLGAVAFLLLIACANVANLLLARAAARHREIAIRRALGAGRWRVVRQLLTESVLLALVGGALGVLLAWWGVETLARLSPRDLTDLGAVELNLPVLGFTLAVSVLTGIIFGLAPAFEATRLNNNEALKEGSRGSTGGARSRRLRAAFVVAETALALILLVGAGLLIRSFARLRSVDPGFRAANVLSMQVPLPRKYAEPQQRINFFKEAVARVGAIPGVESAGAVSFLPFAGLGAATRFTIVGQPPPPPGEDLTTEVRVTDTNYFRTMDIPVVRGRTFNEQEATEIRRVAVVNEAMVRKHFPGEDPIGKRLVVSMSQNPEPTEIVGVVGDVKLHNLTAEVRPTVYWPHPELAYSSMTLVARTTQDPASVAAAARREIQSIDPDQPVSDVRTMEELLSASVARARFSTTLLGVFAAVALLLAVVGIYAVISYTVTQRTHEIGIRMALGAQTRDVLRMVVSHGLLLALAGVGLGLLGAFALTRLMSSLLFEVTSTDPVTFAAVALLLAAVALLACYLPGRRAAKVDPMVALRYE